MRKIVQQYEQGKFRLWNPSMPVATWQDTVQIHYSDNREPEVVKCAEINRLPYVVIRQLTSVENWTDEELAAHFLYVPRDFKPRDGMQRVANSEPEYIVEADNGIREVFAEEPIPPEPPKVDKTPLQRLAEAAGMSSDELAQAIVEAADVMDAKRTEAAKRPEDSIQVPRL